MSDIESRPHVLVAWHPGKPWAESEIVYAGTLAKCRVEMNRLLYLDVRSSLANGEFPPRLVGARLDIRVDNRTDLERNPSCLGDFTGERKIGTVTQSDWSAANKPGGVVTSAPRSVSIVEVAGHVPIQPTITDAERRQRAAQAFLAAKRGIGKTVSVTGTVCAAGRAGPHVVVVGSQDLVATPTGRITPLPSANQIAAACAQADALAPLYNDDSIANIMREWDATLARRGREGDRPNLGYPYRDCMLQPEPERLARERWSAKLRKLQRAEREKERNRIVADLDW